MGTLDLDIPRLRAALADTGFSDISYTASTGSTNADLMAGEAVHRRVLLAGEQTAGKGRLGRQWVSPYGGQLICSISLIVPARHLDHLGLLPIAIGTALTDALPQASLKWPNDLLLDGRKLAGILAEAAPLDEGGYRVVIGFGVNTGLHEAQLPVAHATSLRVAGIEYDATGLAAAVLRAVDRRLEQWWDDREKLIDDYRHVCATIGQKVRLDTPSGPVVGTASGVEADGRIIVDGAAYAAGDVTHLRPGD